MNNPLRAMAGGCIGALVGVIGGFFVGFFVASGGNAPWSKFQEFGAFDAMRGWVVGLICAFVGGIGVAIAGAVVGVSKRNLKDPVTKDVPKQPGSTQS